MKYQIIYADPPWSYREDWGNGAVKHHYKTMSLSDIKSLKVDKIADTNAHLYLWTTNPHMPEALKVMEAWGFEFKQILTWVKTYKDGTPIMGLGYYFRGCTEHLLFGTRGKLKIKNKETKNLFFQERPDNQHSKKPSFFRNMIVECSGDLTRIELFARKEDTLFELDDWKGWDVWGNEVDSDIVL